MPCGVNVTCTSLLPVNWRSKILMPVESVFMRSRCVVMFCSISRYLSSIQCRSSIVGLLMRCSFSCSSWVL